MSAGCHVIFYLFNKKSDLLWRPPTSFSQNKLNSSLARVGEEEKYIHGFRGEA